MGECVKETRLKLRDGSGGLRSVVSSQRSKFYYSSCQFSFQLNSKMLTVYRLIEMVSFELGKEIEKDVFRLVTSVEHGKKYFFIS